MSKLPLTPTAHLRLDIVLPLLNSEPAPKVVEVGAGMGGLSWHLAQGRAYLGFEPDRESFVVAAERLRGLSNAELRNEVLPARAEDLFDALIALEVLEHIEEDVSALRDWSYWVRPGGRVLVSVPAKHALYGAWDRQVGHYRRYEREQLESLLLEAGLGEVRVLAYGMPVGYLLDALRNKMLARRLSSANDVESRTRRSGRTFQPKRWGGLISLLVLPFRLMQRPFINTNFGIGWVGVGRVKG